MFASGVAIALLIALVCGGSSSSPLSALIVRLACLPIAAAAIVRLRGRVPRAGFVAGAALLVGALVLGLAQLAPLPPNIWTRLPGREAIAAIYRTIGVTQPWRAISLTPSATWDAVLGLLPPAAMFCALASVSFEARRRVALAIPLAALASVALGVVQVLGREVAHIQFYESTNPGSAVGFFANRNHQAVFALAAIPFMALIGAGSGKTSHGRRGFEIAMAGVGIIVLLIGVAQTRSRAGVILSGPAVAGAVWILARGRSRVVRATAPALVTALAALVGAGLVGSYAFSPIAARFEAPMSTELRLQAAPAIIALALDYSPLGAGGGAFAKVYEAVERPETMPKAYLNHAHDDYLEAWVEWGWAGPGLIALFSLWYASQVANLVRNPGRPGSGLALAGALIVGMFMAHSFVDYPLRTPGLSALFAFACGLIVPPSSR